MSNYVPIENLDINDDYILDVLREKKGKISFLQDQTRESIKELRDIDLHLQTTPLIEIWKKLIDDAIIFLKLKDQREKYHDKMTLGTDVLFDFLKEFQDFEPILYGAVPNYRDHIAHVFRVFLLGQNIIKKAIGFEHMNPVRDDLPISPEEKEALWCIASLTHDLGYSLERIQYINQKARKMLQQFGNLTIQELGYGYFAQFGIISDFVVKFLSSDIVETKNEKSKFSTHLQSKYYQKFLSALTGFNHGVISSVILMKTLVYFKESDYLLDQIKPLDERDARQFLIRKEILRTIASHSCDDIYYLGIKNFPFMLKVCDEMQEWGRPRLIDVTKRGGSNTELRINRFDDKLVDYKITFKTPEGYKPSPPERENIKKGIKDYFRIKCKSWLNVLRSAVGGDMRSLKLKFCVEDNTQPEAEIFTLEHTLPSQVKIRPKEIQNEFLA
jgi:hypothetical protein